MMNSQKRILMAYERNSESERRCPQNITEDSVCPCADCLAIRDVAGTALAAVETALLQNSSERAIKARKKDSPVSSAWIVGYKQGLGVAVEIVRTFKILEEADQGDEKS